MESTGWPTAVQLLQVATRLTEGIDNGVRRRGFEGLRPSHGFAFVRISAGDATTGDVGEFLGITKQSAGQLVDHLVAQGYVTRERHPHDARARLLRLTARGWACTRAAEESAAETMDGWRNALGAAEFGVLQSALARLSTPGPLRPSW